MKERDRFEDRGLDWKIILKWFLNGTGRRGLGLSCSGQGHVAGFCEYGNEPSSLVNSG
jgi:hypothetical protein